MRHGNGLRKLNSTNSHRLAMLRNMMNSLLTHEVIKTTLPKASVLKKARKHGHELLRHSCGAQEPSVIVARANWED